MDVSQPDIADRQRSLCQIGEVLQPALAVAELLGRNTRAVQNAQVQARHRRALGIAHVATRLELPRAAGEKHRADRRGYACCRR